MKRLVVGRLRRRLWIACTMLIVAPLSVVWALGWYDVLDARGQKARLAEAAPHLHDALQHGSEASMLSLADEHGIHARVVSPTGAVIVANDPSIGEIRTFRDEPGRSVADFFFGPGGAPELGAADAELGPLPSRAEIVEARAGRTVADHVTSRSGHLQLVHHASPLPAGRVLYLTTASRRNARSLFDSRYELLKLTLGLVVAAALVGAWLSRTIVRPIEQLRRRVHDYLRSGLAGDLELRRADELGALSRDFDRLRLRLHDRLQHATTSAADLAHEVKSPATTVATAAEILADGGGASEADRQRIARALAEAAHRLHAATEAMLTLARLEQEVAEAQRHPTEIGALVRDVLDAMVDRGSVAIVHDLPSEPVYVLGTAKLAEAVRNLVDNARGFALARVAVEVTCIDGRVRIDVADDGPGIPANARDRVFSRFYSARPPGDARGTGLGLSIAASIAESHGGTLELVDQPRGSRFRLELPVDR